MVEYKYDAWGNHAVLNASGGDIEEGTHLDLWRKCALVKVEASYGTPFDNNPNLVVPIGDGFGFIIQI